MSRTRETPFKLTDEDYARLAKEGADARLTRRQSVFNAAISRCLGVKPVPLDATQVAFIRSFDTDMETWAKKIGFALRDE